VGWLSVGLVDHVALLQRPRAAKRADFLHLLSRP
jgi:hypothetical protein